MTSGSARRTDPACEMYAVGALAVEGDQRVAHAAPQRSGQGVDGFLGGCVGPIGYDRGWARCVAHGALKGVGEAGAAALIGEGPRSPRAPRHSPGRPGHLAAARARDGGDFDLNAACAAVAGSFSERSAPTAPMIQPPGFDPRLLACDPDALALLGARRGGRGQRRKRVLAWGPA